MPTISKTDWVAGEEVSHDDLNLIGQNINTGSPFVYDINAGETMDGTTNPVFVYLDTTGKLKKADASYTDIRKDVIGAVLNSTTDANPAELQTEGILTIPTQTLETTISEKIDQENIEFTTADTAEFTSTNQRFSQVFQVGKEVGNLSKIVIKTAVGAGTPTAKIEIYAVDAVGKPTGSALATSQTATIVGSGDYLTTFTFATPFVVLPSEIYCMVVVPVTVAAGTRFTLSVQTDGNFKHYNIVKIGSVAGIAEYLTYYTTNAGVDWSANPQLYFKTYTTKTIILPGDPIYLSVTAGALSLLTPTETASSCVKIGELLSTTKMKLNIGTDEKFLGSTKMTKNNDTNGSLYAPIIHRMRKAIIKIEIGSATTTSREVELYLVSKNSFTVYDDSGNAIVISLTENTIEIDYVGAYLTATIYYYS